ncbi:DUF3983 domain-containing protein [Robertmurraya korlensis]|nr:DUF3983 domain-containing protein [Robertmurraya korlensis]MCM3600651.1 DUF3983 domain-containing protein [Robertmurraya korlensis]
MARVNRKKRLDDKLSREKKQAEQEQLNKAFRNILVKRGVLK